jgi:hypothetical protein
MKQSLSGVSPRVVFQLIIGPMTCLVSIAKVMKKRHEQGTQEPLVYLSRAEIRRACSRVSSLGYKI